MAHLRKFILALRSNMFLFDSPSLLSLLFFFHCVDMSELCPTELAKIAKGAIVATVLAAVMIQGFMFHFLVIITDKTDFCW